MVAAGALPNCPGADGGRPSVGGSWRMQAEHRTVRENSNHQPERTRAFALRVTVIRRPLGRPGWRGGIRDGMGIFPRRAAARRPIMESWIRTALPKTTPRQLEHREPNRAADAAAFLAGPAPRRRGRRVADYLGTDVTATRVGLAAVAVLGHVAIPAYAAAWALIPEEGKSRSRAAEFLDSMADRVDSAVSRVRQA